jgi:hypothetical protein
MNTKELQDKLILLLQDKFNDSEVKSEWDVAKESQDDYNRKLYCPRVDIAVSPFNINRESSDRIEIYQSCNKYKFFIEKLKRKGVLIGDFDFNVNPRCFIAIEIEASGSRKHMLGDIMNASVFGALGIVIAIGDDKFNQFVKMKRYIDFAVENQKMKSRFNNVILIEKEDFIKIVEEEIGFNIA